MSSTLLNRKFNLKTKQGKLFKALVVNRETMSEAEIANRFGLKNPTATISAIRQRGYVIYANTRKAGNNVKVTDYHYGTANRELVALAYRAQSLGITV